MFGKYYKSAMNSIKGSKLRSLLTVMGVIIGIVSVVTMVSLGEGVKRQVVGQIDELGSDLITVRPGRVVQRDASGEIMGVDLLNLFNTGSLNERDWQAIQKVEGVDMAVPFGVVTGTAATEQREFSNGYVLATTHDVPDVLSKKIEYGAFFTESDGDKPVAIIGKRVAEQLFQENVPIGKSLEVRGESFIVRGVFEEFETTPLTPNINYNTAIFIPYEIGKNISSDQMLIYQILVKPTAESSPDAVKQAIEETLLQSRAGQKDFTVLKQDESLALASTVFDMLTAMIAGVAAISLLVGGIGIMNIMLVSVTERTKEIGVRKAVGATNRQIYNQFLVEATILSLMGGILGVIISILINYLIRIFTDLQPVITWPVVVIAAGVALAVGVLFGVAPALKAARKDPIEALRN